MWGDEINTEEKKQAWMFHKLRTMIKSPYAK